MGSRTLLAGPGSFSYPKRRMTQATITWNIDPFLLKAGAISIRWYSVFLLISFYASYRFMMFIFDRENRSRETVLSYGLFILAGLFIGGRLFHCLAYEPEYYLKYPWDIIKPWRGVLGENARFVGYRGMSGHGSAIGIVIGIMLNAIRTKTGMVWMLDRIALFGPLIGFFVRMGNLFNSEILGTPSDLPWAFLFVRADPLPRHPVQLYEALAYLLIFFFSFRYYLRRAGREKPGEFLGLVLTLVYSSRFLLEFLKAKQSYTEAGLALNMGQLLSIPMILAGLFLLLRPVTRLKISLACCLLVCAAVVRAGVEPDTAFNNQFRREIGGWIAADATYSIHLPDGRTLWLFGDTFIGEVNENGAIVPGSRFIRNSAVIQEGKSLQTLFSGTRSSPGDFIPADHPDSTWYWPEHGVVENDTLRIIVAKFRKNPDAPAGFQFAHAGNDIASFTFPALEFTGTVPISCHPVNDVIYGDRVLADSTHLYIYGRKNDDPAINIPYPHVARCPVGKLMDQQWEFYSGSGWSSDPTATKRINSFQVSQQYSVSTYMGKYILLTQDIWLSPKIFSFVSDSPAGPWENRRLIYTTPESSDDLFTYNAYAHPQFDRNGEMLVSYNVNGDFWSIFSDVEIYRPRFIRIPYMNLDYAFWPNPAEDSRPEGSMAVHLYPNPAAERIFIDLRVNEPGPLCIRIYDTGGRLMAETPVISQDQGIQQFELDIRDLPPGLYICRIGLTGEIRHLPFVKSNSP